MVTMDDLIDQALKFTMNDLIDQAEKAHLLEPLKPEKYQPIPLPQKLKKQKEAKKRKATLE